MNRIDDAEIMMSRKAIEYCDVVMKGGITSGVVYPSAVLALAKRYTFKNIGGTSAGAIAAAALAAAALGERRRSLAAGTQATNRGAVGLSGLKDVADQLQEPGFILSLFQPGAGMQRMFALLLTFTRTSDVAPRLRAIVSTILLTAPVTVTVAAVVLLWPSWAVAGASGFALMLFPALFLAFALGALVSLRFAAERVRANSLGLCSGRGASSGETPSDGLTEWLHHVVQTLSGQDERPLLFQDLWDAPRFPDEPGTKGVSLEMITTGISHHEPRRLPFEDSRFWFRRDQFLNLFPEAVVDWMAAQDPAPLKIDGLLYHRLPDGGQLPVIVATRMSLSFPLLLSAVPLYEGVWKSAVTIKEATQSDRDTRSLIQAADALAVGGRRGQRPPKQVRICWFSDGGIGSNFPIHLFDAPLPRWPTFALDLVYPQTRDVAPGKDVFLPTSNNEGWQRRYTSTAAPGAISEITSFLFGIIATMQNWRDTLQARAPGQRDRIVSIALAGDEGGMNLDMSEDVVRRIAEKGERAGQLLIDRFDFNNHWWIRWRNVASAVERFTIGFAKAASAPPTASYADARSTAATGEPDAPSYPFSGAQAEEAQHRFADMIHEGDLWEDTVADLTTKAPKPLPQLRITPTF